MTENFSGQRDFMKPRTKCLRAGGKILSANKIWLEKHLTGKVNLNNSTTTFRNTDYFELYNRVAVQ